MAKTETQIQKEILDWLKGVGFFCWRQNSQGMKGRPSDTKGIPDICGILPDGRFMGIEVKKHGGKPSQVQVKWHLLARKNKAMCFIAYSLDEVIKVLHGEGYYDTKRGIQANPRTYSSWPG